MSLLATQRKKACTRCDRQRQLTGVEFKGVTTMSQAIKLTFLGATLSLSLGCGAATRTAQRPPCHGVQRAPVAVQSSQAMMQKADYTAPTAGNAAQMDNTKATPQAAAKTSGCGGCPGMRAAAKRKAAGESAPKKVNSKSKKSGCKNPNLEQASRL